MTDEKPTDETNKVKKVVDDKGRIAYYSKVAAPQIVATGFRQVHFSYRNGVSLAWVEPEYEETVANKKIGCCGRKKLNYFPASAEQVEKWRS